MSEIRRRLNAAYEQIEFFANSNWLENDDPYHRAKQELYLRECKVRDTIVDDFVRPRTVQDCIPQSRLAQYANYEYNESRELCYASNSSNVYFYYPCIYNRGSIKEPWMMPEVEQLFIWFTCAPDFSILELLRLEELNHLDEDDSGLALSKEFHEISPVFFQLIERTPGKPRYTSPPPISEVDLFKFLPSQLKIQTFEDMILRMKIRSEKIKYLWSEHSQPKLEKMIEKKNLLKTPLGSYFILKTNKEVGKRGDGSNIKKNDFAHLQYLADSLKVLGSLIFSPSKENYSYGPSTLEIVSKVDTPPPARRLYSAVLQGLADQTSISADLTPPLASLKEIQLVELSNSTHSKTFSCFSSEKTSCKSATIAKNQMPAVASQWISPSSSKSHTLLQEHKPQKSVACKLISSSITTLCGDLNRLNGPNQCAAAPTYTQPPTYNYTYNYNYNYSQYNNLLATTATPQFFATHQSRPAQSQFNRGPYPSNNQIWFVQIKPPPPVYSMAHFGSQPYFYLPPQPPQILIVHQQQPLPALQSQPRSNQQWEPTPPPPPPTHYLKTTPPPQQQQSHQAWMQNQNLYWLASNSNSTTGPTVVNQNRSKRSKKLNQSKELSRSDGNLDLSSSRKSTGSSDVAFSLVFVKRPLKSMTSATSIDYKKSKTDCTQIKKRLSSSTFKEANENVVCSSDSEESRRILPIAASFSEDLERHALEQYQQSNENFYKDLE